MSVKVDLAHSLSPAWRLGRAICLVWRSAPGWTLANLALTLAQGLLPLVALYALKRVVHGVTSGLAAADKVAASQEVGTWLVFAAAIALATALCRSLGEMAGEAQSLLVTDAVADVLHAQSVAADLEYYEGPRYYDTLHRAQQEAPYRPTRILNGLLQVCQSGLALIGIAGLLFAFNWLIALVLFLAAVPGGIARLVYSRRLYKLEQQQTEGERRSWYYHWLMTSAEHAKELRLFGLGPLFRARHRELRCGLRVGRLALSRRRALADFLAQGLATLGIFGTFGLAALRAVEGSISLGDLG